ncbi:hypothetical protein CR201_G0036382 [Pongo abelii]|uniref:Uncharacterized protein n=1 Tax=Pongo abelii TaxID=9601 RepID=A0A2J8TC63_PONAB|nr:hypothetical protein CR201_G0036382 [Pongo abelii]
MRRMEKNFIERWNSSQRRGDADKNSGPAEQRVQKNSGCKAVALLPSPGTRRPPHVMGSGGGARPAQEPWAGGTEQAGTCPRSAKLVDGRNE